MADLGKRSRDRACLALVFWFWSVCVYLRMWLSSFIVRALRLSIFVYFWPFFFVLSPFLLPSFVFCSSVLWWGVCLISFFHIKDKAKIAYSICPAQWICPLLSGEIMALVVFRLRVSIARYG